MPRSFGPAAELLERVLARAGRERSTQAIDGADPLVPGACSNIESVSASVHAAWTSTVVSTPPARAAARGRPARTCAGWRRARPSSRPWGAPLEIPEVLVCVDDHGLLRADCASPRRRSAGGLRNRAEDARREPTQNLPRVRLRDERRARCRRSSAPSCPDRGPERRDAERADLGRELRDAAVLGAGLDRLHLVREASKPTRMIPPGLMPAFLIDWIAPSAGGPQAE